MAEQHIIEPFLDVEGEGFQVLRYELTEELSEVSWLRAELTQHDAGERKDPTPPKDLISKTATLTLRRDDGGQERQFVGRIVSARRQSDEDEVQTVHVEIAPAPWALTKRRDSRVFQEMPVKDIVLEVLDKAGVGSDKVDWQAAGKHPDRAYCVQYRETDFDFVRRLCSEEGIYFAVHHLDGSEKVIFGDEPIGLGEIEGETTLAYHYGMGMDRSGDVITRVEQSHRVVTDKVMLRDYNYEKPKLEVEATVESEDDGEHVLEAYDYPGRGLEPPEIERLAKITSDQLQARRQVVRGEAATLALRPGLRFTIEGHPYEALNQEVLVTSVTITGTTPRLGALEEGNEDAFVVTFTAVPTKHRYSPTRRPRAAEAIGLSTVVTTGPPGEEIHVDETASVTIRYPWDRLGPEDDGSSRWVRTLQLGLGDSMLLPRMKWEVYVDHDHGDIDRPLVMGRLYNAHTPPPYNLPDEANRSSLQTATSPGGGSSNEMRLGDGAGSEEIFFNASKDMKVDVKNNTTESVGNNASKKVGSNQEKNITDSLTATVGGSQSVSVSGNQKVAIETRAQDEIAGDHTLDVGGTRTMMIGGDHKMDVGGSSKLQVGGMNIDLVVGSVTHETLGSFTHNVGSALIDITPSDRSLTVGGSVTETAGAAKIIGTMGGRGVEVGGAMTQQVAGAIVNLADGDRAESAGGTYTEIAAGASVVKADNIKIEADGMINLVMGASIISINPAMVTLMGVSLKLDGKVSDLGALVIDN